MPTPLVRYLITEAERLGVQNVSVDVTRRHYHLVGDVAGNRLLQVVSRTPSDKFGVYRIARAQLRRDVRRLSNQSLPQERTALAKRKRRHNRSRTPTRVVSPIETTPTRLDRDPWRVLHQLIATAMPAPADVGSPSS